MAIEMMAAAQGYLAQLGPIKASAFDWDEVERNPGVLLQGRRPPKRGPGE